MSIRIGICGVGSFAGNFIPLFKAHPEVENVVLCDLDEAKLSAQCARHGIPDRCASLDELCMMDVDAIAIITQHHLHGPQAVQALNAGKHVYSAVPSAISMEEITQLVRTVEKTGRIYMIGETSYYYPCAIYCRDRFRRGDFGHIVYGEAEYYHDYSHGMYDVLKCRHGKDWERYANWPPFFYPTHSTSMIVSTTGAHATHVSGMGYVDRNPDGLFQRADSFWNNHFSDETMLCRMSNGSIARISEFRRVGHPCTARMRLYGTEACYEEQLNGSIWTTRTQDGYTDVTDQLRCKAIAKDDIHGKMTKLSASDDMFRDVAPIHPVHLLPKSFRGMPNGHLGSHQFLVHDFVTACVTGITPPNSVWVAARYLVPGLIAHESALKGGVLMEVPDFGDPK